MAATFSYLFKMAFAPLVQLVRESLKDNGAFAKSVNAYTVKITYKSVAEDLLMLTEYEELAKLLA